VQMRCRTFAQESIEAGMLIEVKVPQLSESVAEATLLTWHKKAGERVRRDENLVDIETDKVVLETPAPEHVEAVVARHAQEPSVERERRVVPIDRARQPEEDVAPSVLGRVRRAEQVAAETEHAPGPEPRREREEDSHERDHPVPELDECVEALLRIRLVAAARPVLAAEA